ncbi:unnamed protein product [Acanthosepion pharaonis]|uniref:DUF7041 domain-containing protein n=1 Tax=Acanthosepion pharaonis TaxID=158019 RepID=A0A812CJP6_ACAPH|nr:unnamed protein product [Sepia pharaonis]
MLTTSIIHPSTRSGLTVVKAPTSIFFPPKGTSINMADSAPPTQATLKVDLPTYNTNLQTWFIQLDAIFQAIPITSEQLKFASVVEKLPADVASEVADILNDLPSDKPYEVLKQAILQRTGCSEERKFRELLTNVTLGSSKPSQLLRRMQTLLGANSMSEAVLKQMWLDKDTVQILPALTDNMDIQKLAAIADKISDTCPAHRNASVVPLNDPTPDINQQLQALDCEVKKLSLCLNEAQNTQSRSRSNSVNRYCVQRRRFTSRRP